DDDANALFDAVRAHGASPSVSARWIVNELPRARDEHPSEKPLAPQDLAGLITLIADERVTGAAAREILGVLVEQGGNAESIMQERGLERLSDDSAILPMVQAVLHAHPSQVEDYKAGNERLIGFFIGKVMQKSEGRADAGRVRALLQQELSQ